MFPSSLTESLSLFSLPFFVFLVFISFVGDYTVIRILFNNLSISKLSIYQSYYFLISIHLLIIYLSVYLSISLFIYLSTYLSINLSRSKEKEDAKEFAKGQEAERIKNKIFELEFKQDKQTTQIRELSK